MSKGAHTTRGLLEDALLDVYGMLDDEQRERFEQAFRSAPPALQAELRRAQTRFAKFTGFLPEVDAPIELRSKVLSAVRQAVDGKGSSVLRLTDGADPEPMEDRRYVSRVWRIVSLATATAAVVMGATVLQMRSDFDTIRKIVYADDGAKISMALGGLQLRDLLYSRDSRLFAFDVVDEQAVPAYTLAKFVYSESSKQGVVFTSKLPALDGTEYVVAVVNEQGDLIKRLTTITNSSNIDVGTKVDFVAEAGQRIAIFAENLATGVLGNPILMTAPIRA